VLEQFLQGEPVQPLILQVLDLALLDEHPDLDSEQIPGRIDGTVVHILGHRGAPVELHPVLGAVDVLQ